MRKSISGGGIWKASYLGLAWLLVISCSEEINPVYTPPPVQENASLTAGAAVEDFEKGVKTSYIDGIAALDSGNWRLVNALIGSSDEDHKYGEKALRIIDTGRASMQYDSKTGVSEVHISHAIYGSDGESVWSLWLSADGGNSYGKVGESVTTSSVTLDEAVFAVSHAGNVRFEIRRESGSAKGLDIDDVEIVKYVAPQDPGDGPVTTEPDNSNYLFGNPSGAVADAANSENNYLFDKNYYIMSYNRSRATPNWVSWHLDTAACNGKVDRLDNFRADTSLPAGWYEASKDAFSGSGFDRGHNCPSADRTSTMDANGSTFLMSNMIPQAPNNNQKAWADFENYIRKVLKTAGQVGEAYVVMGNYGVGGTGSGGYAETVDGGKVTVPKRVWKVVVFLLQGTDDLGRVTTSTRVIAIDTPNENSVGNDWWTYRTSVDAIEAATGYDVLSALPDAIEDVLEAKVDNGPTN